MNTADGRTDRARTPTPGADPADRPGRSGSGRWRARTLWWARSVVLGLVAMFLALLVTPEVSVSTFGQTVQVGAVRPPAALAWSGPGEADLFGEGPVATVLQFEGFIRPLIVWQRFTKGRAASEFLQSSTTNSGRSAGTDISRVGSALASGWAEYLLRLAIVAALLGVALHLAVVGAGVLAHRRGHRGRRRSVTGVLVTGILAVVLTGACAASTVVSAYRQLHTVTSLADLVGTAQLAPVPVAAGPAHPGVHVVVIGDSTAAGDGNPLVAHPTAEDRACFRSRDSYAQDLHAVTGEAVLNLACSSATIAHGLLGPQSTRGVTLLPQVSRLKALSSESAVVVSIGANDIGWSDFLYYCAMAPQCDDRASQQLFQSRLDRFKIQYAQLLQQLADLPTHPTVVVNEYYDPFGPWVACLRPHGSGSSPSPTTAPTPSSTGPTASSTGAVPSTPPSPTRAANTGTRTLGSDLTRLNTVLAQGAQAFHDLVARPDFAGHTLCSHQPWVQGLTQPAPFHPTAAGELAIAAADLRGLLDSTAPTASSQRQGSASPTA